MSASASDPSKDDWTFVSTKRRGGSKHAQTRNDSLNEQRTIRWPPVSKDLTVEKITADYRARSRTWRASSCRAQVCQIFDRLHPAGSKSLTNAICLGSGSFSRDNLQSRRRSMFQLAAFMDSVAHLQQNNTDTLALFAQDPAYTSLDEDFLQSLGFTVFIPKNTNDQSEMRAYQVIEATSFVCELFMERRPPFLKALLDNKADLVMGSMLIDVHQIAMQKTRATSALQTLRKASDLQTTHPTINDETAKLEFAELEEEYCRSYRPYRIPRFEEDPHIFEGLHISSRDDDDE